MESAAGTGCELTAADCLEEQIFIKKKASLMLRGHYSGPGTNKMMF